MFKTLDFALPKNKIYKTGEVFVQFKFKVSIALVAMLIGSPAIAKKPQAYIGYSTTIPVFLNNGEIGNIYHKARLGADIKHLKHHNIVIGYELSYAKKPANAQKMTFNHPLYYSFLESDILSLTIKARIPLQNKFSVYTQNGLSHHLTKVGIKSPYESHTYDAYRSILPTASFGVEYQLAKKISLTGSGVLFPVYNTNLTKSRYQLAYTGNFGINFHI